MFVALVSIPASYCESRRCCEGYRRISQRRACLHSLSLRSNSSSISSKSGCAEASPIHAPTLAVAHRKTECKLMRVEKARHPRHRFLHWDEASHPYASSRSQCIRNWTRSAHEEDIVLLPTLLRAANGTSGTFVELGAFDGVHSSNTIMLETCFGWKGLLIEPNQASFSLLKRAKRHAKLANTAICAEVAGTVRMTKEGGVRAHVVQDGEQPQAHGKKRAILNVPCHSLSHIMRSNDFPTAHFLSLECVRPWLDYMDLTPRPNTRSRHSSPSISRHNSTHRALPPYRSVEGFEAHVLEAVDPASFEVIMVETDGSDSAKERRVRTLIERAGLRRHTLLSRHLSLEKPWSDAYLAPHLHGGVVTPAAYEEDCPDRSAVFPSRFALTVQEDGSCLGWECARRTGTYRQPGSL
jgi:hypothetical protein